MVVSFLPQQERVDIRQGRDIRLQKNRGCAPEGISFHPLLVNATITFSIQNIKR